MILQDKELRAPLEPLILPIRNKSMKKGLKNIYFLVAWRLDKFRIGAECAYVYRPQ
jgi:hypothetical protein